MNKDEIVAKTAEYVEKSLTGESTGHDWWHAYRVWKTAVVIAEKEKDADLFVVQLAALLHDIADWKFNDGNEEIGPELARTWLGKLGVGEDIISHICEIIKDSSFKGANIKPQMKTKEGMIVQDADKLDALGAIGIARCFATGSKLNREIYDPDLKPKMHDTFEDYRNAKSTSINHFYEKLLLLKERMNTKTGKKLAKERHKFMEQFLNRFLKEWELKV